MAIIPIGHFEGGVLVRHEGRDHEGLLPWEALTFGQRLRAGRLVEDRDWIVLPCPACGRDGTGEWAAWSAHPVSGGCAPEMVQALFVAVYERHPAVPATDAEAAHALARARCEATDGPGRWCLVSPEEGRRRDEAARQEALALLRRRGADDPELAELARRAGLSID